MTATIQPMVESAKSLAKNITHPGLVADWRKNNNLVSSMNTLSCEWVEQTIFIMISYYFMIKNIMVILKRIKLIFYTFGMDLFVSVQIVINKILQSLF